MICESAHVIAAILKSFLRHLQNFLDRAWLPDILPKMKKFCVSCKTVYGYNFTRLYVKTELQLIFISRVDMAGDRK